MAMIRGRQFGKSKESAAPVIQVHSSKDKPLACLKEQRRIIFSYSKNAEKSLVPIDDPDPYYEDKKTFVVLNKSRTIFRFSEAKSLFLFGRNSKLRLSFIGVLINKWFNGLVIATILVNCLIMMINGNEKAEWSEKYVEHIFTAIYTVEALVKIVGRGFIFHPFSYLRDAWNWLDFVVILAAYVLVIVAHASPESGGSEEDSPLGSLTFLRALRVLRVFKTVSVIPGLRMIVSALLASTKALKDAMLLSLLGFSMFSLVGIQLFRGTLQHKCVLLPPGIIEYDSCLDASSSISVNSTTASECQICLFEEKCGAKVRSLFGQATLDEMRFIIQNYNSSVHLDFSTNTIPSRNNYSHGPLTVDETIFTTFLPYSNSTTPVINSTSRDFVTNQPPTTNVQLLEDYRPRAMTYNQSSWMSWNYKIPSNEIFNSTGYNFSLNNWFNDEAHYLKNELGIYQLCGNHSSALTCPKFTICLRRGSNPNYGFTSFDNFVYAFLSVFRLSLQDNWEELYLQILETNGQLAWFFFLAMIFLGSYYLVNLILAVVASSYEDQRKSVANSLEEEKRELLQEKEAMKKRRNAALSSIKLKTQSKTKNLSVVERCCPCGKIKEILLLWSCCVGNSFLCQIREKLKTFFMNSTAEMLTVSLVILNTLVMALEQEPKEKSFETFLSMSNKIFTYLFTAEMVLKMFALSPYDYFKVTWNIFDFVVVTLSLFEIVISDELPNGLSVLRAFRLIRLVRILKLAKSWPTLSKLMQMIADSLGKVSYLTLVLLIVLVIFALAGMQTVGNLYHLDSLTGIPLRWHMHDFPHAFLVVFRIQCGEWIQSMWQCMNSVQEQNSQGMIPVCLFIFLGVVFVGNLVVLNLFLALLLNSFSSDALSNGKGKGKSAKRVLKSLRKAGKKALPKLSNTVTRSRKVAPSQREQILSSNGAKEHYGPSKNLDNRSIDENKKTGLIYDKPDVVPDQAVCRTNSLRSNNGHLHRASVMKEQRNSDLTGVDNVSQTTEECTAFETNGCNNNSVIASQTDIVVDVIKCDFEKCETAYLERQEKKEKRKKDHFHTIKKFTWKEKWANFRQQMNKIVKHNIFETFIIFVITLSSVALIFEDIHLDENQKLKSILNVFDRIFTVIFVIEMFMKWIGFGFKKYFTNGWCLLDFAIVVVSLVSLGLEISASLSEESTTDLSSLRVLRSLRAFRPLRAMSRFHGIKVVTDALFRSIPSILNVFVICLIFWLVFAIMGVNLFAGKMFSCKWKETGEKVWHPDDFKSYPALSEKYEPSPIKVYNRSTCLELANYTEGKVHWSNLPVNFDNVAIAYISLLQVATFKGWMPIMFAAVDAPGNINDQPIRDNQIVMYFFFVAFIILGAFFTLNLFISVVIDSFNQQKKKFELAGAELFLSESQKKAYSAMKKLKTKLPRQLLPVPKSRWRERLYLVVTSDKFELGVLIVTILNLFAMAIEYEGMTKAQDLALECVNYVFIGLFTIEIALRVIAMGHSFFYIPWNVFDFLLILVSLLVNIISIVLVFNSKSSGGPIISTSPWLPMLRMVRVVRILRVARVASGIRTLLFALMLSAPALINVGSLLLLFMFIYAIFGMSQFSHVLHRGAINDILNFETFPSTFLLLFQMSTSAGWDGFMEPTLYVEGDDSGCDKVPGSCMSSTFIGYFYFVSYLLITFVIVTNMYIAIILENFEIATKDNDEELTADDFEHFFDMWQRFDKSANGRLSVEELSDLLNVLDKPLGISQPNKQQIAEMAIPLCEKYELHIVDVAAALIKKIIGSEGFSDEMEEELKTYFESHAKDSIATDNGVRISDTWKYSEMMKKQEQERGVCKDGGAVSYLVKRVRETLLIDNFPISHQSFKKKSVTKLKQPTFSVTRAEIHLPFDPEVILSCSKEVSKEATILKTTATCDAPSPKPMCDVVDCNSGQVIITNEIQRLSKDTNQNNSSVFWKTENARTDEIAMITAPCQHQDTIRNLKTYCSRGADSADSQTAPLQKRENNKELPLVVLSHVKTKDQKDKNTLSNNKILNTSSTTKQEEVMRITNWAIKSNNS